MRALEARTITGSRAQASGDAPRTVPRLGELVCRWPDEVDAARRYDETRRQINLQREDFVEDRSESGLSPVERHAAALRVAALNGWAPLADYHRGRLKSLAADAALIAAAGATAGTDGLPERHAAILAFVDVVTEDPRGIRRAHLKALEKSGLRIAEIAVLTRLIAFANYEGNILADLDPLERSQRREIQG